MSHARLTLAQVVAHNKRVALEALPKRVSHAQPEQASGKALVNNAPGKDKSGPRITVRIIRHARRVLDADNFTGGCKPIIDQLRYFKIISDDDPASIALEFHQEKVQTKNEEGTTIQIEEL